MLLLTYCKLVLRPDEDGGDLCEADNGDLCEADRGKRATAHFPRTPRLPPSFSENFHTVKTHFFLAASQLKEKKLETFSATVHETWLAT